MAKQRTSTEAKRPRTTKQRSSAPLDAVVRRMARMSPEEAEAAYEAAPAVPLSKKRIAEIVRYAVNGGARSSKLTAAIRTLRRFIGPIEHHPRCSSRQREKCDCYGRTRIAMHAALETILGELP